MRKLVLVVVLIVLALGVAWQVASRAVGPGPSIDIESPATAIGQTGQLRLNVEAPGGKLSRVDVDLEQNGVRVPLVRFPGEEAVQSGSRFRFVREIGKRQFAQLDSGPARLVVTAERPLLFGLRRAVSSAARDIDVRLAPPTIEVVSTFHYVNHGGSELIVYRVSPSGAVSGVRVGEHEYVGFPASGAGVSSADEGLRVAFFALLWDQDPKLPMTLFAHDDIGNESSASFDYRVFPKKFRRSRIDIDDRFLAKVVPEILRSSPDLAVNDPSDLLASFLVINRELRSQNNAQIARLAQDSAPQILWQGPFKQLLNTAVEGGFADQRTYVYKGQEVDRQTHLGFDLASTANAPVVAANRGKVVHADSLGIYGRCVILDHGMGLQSLYAHLSSIEVSPGQFVNQGDQLGRSGSTGLAAGDHLHFTMLLHGQPVTPIDWWSGKWVQDRIARKLRDASSSPESSTGH